MNRVEQNTTEIQRLKALRQYAILDTPREQAFDELARLASEICKTPMSAISFIDADRQWNKSTVGWTTQEIPRQSSLCAQAIDRSEMVVIEDAASDHKSRENPFVREAPRIRFYAGVPLNTTSMGATIATGRPLSIGTLCVMDTVPRKLSAEQTEALRILAKQVITQLELRRSISDLQEKHT